MKYAMITGASSGIGREFARQLARKGYSLILVARRGKRLEKLAQELVKYGCQTEIIAADLSQPKECVRVMKETKEFPIKIFINNAGFGACGDFTDTDAATELQMIDVNVKAMHLLMKLMLKKMEKQENQGYILNVASSAGLLPAGPFMATYYATKAYMVSLTRAVAAEQRSKRSRIYVGALCPGPVDTEFNDVAKVKFALPGTTPQYCASYALEQMRKRKTIIVPKFTIRAATTMARFVPQKMLIPVIGQLQKKKF